MLYDIPIRTGRKINHDVIVRLANEVPNIVGLKDAAANPGATARVVAETPDEFEVYSGDDAMTLPLLAVGAVGTISVAGHWTAHDQVEMLDRFAAGDVAGARAVNDRLLESWAFETGDDAPNPIPAKAMLRHLGVEVGECRLPLGPAPDWVNQRAARGVDQLGGVAWLSRSGSSSSAGSEKSAVTAWRSSRGTATTARSCSSTAG